MTTQTRTNRFEKDKFYLTIGETIRAHREAEGLSVREIAAKAGLAHNTIQNAECGLSISLLVIVKIAEALDCSIDSLVPTEATR